MFRNFPQSTDRHAFRQHVRMHHGDMPREDAWSHDISMEQLCDFGVVPRTLNWADDTEKSDDAVEILDLKMEPEN